MRRGGVISQFYRTRTQGSENWKCSLILCSGWAPLDAFLRVLTKKYVPFDFTFNCEWSTFFKFRIQSLMFLSENTGHKLHEFLRKQKSVGTCLLPCQVPLLEEGWRKLFSNVIFRCLTNEAFFPPFIPLYLLLSFTFNKMCGKDLSSTMGVFLPAQLNRARSCYFLNNACDCVLTKIRLYFAACL